MKIHDRDYLYKYASAETAKKILENRTVKWSSPRLFNDPFDMQFRLHFSFERAEFKQAVMRKIKERLTDRASDRMTSTTAPLPFALDLLRSIAPPMSGEEVEAKFENAVAMGIDKMMKEGLAALHEKTKDVSRKLMVFCVSEIHDNLLMWAHYTDMHEGAVIKFKCIPEHDTALCAAFQVKYQDEMPRLDSLDDLVAVIFGEKEPQRDTFKRIAYTKSSEWAYEKEWRCIAYLRDPDGHDFELITVAPQEIDALYLGCRMRDSHKKDLMALLVDDFSNVAVFVAKKNDKMFKLDFERIR